MNKRKVSDRLLLVLTGLVLAGLCYWVGQNLSRSVTFFYTYVFLPLMVFQLWMENQRLKRRLADVERKMSELGSLRGHVTSPPPAVENHSSESCSGL